MGNSAMARSHGRVMVNKGLYSYHRRGKAEIKNSLGNLKVNHLNKLNRE